MRTLVLIGLLAATATASLGGAAQAGGWRHGPPCPDAWYWRGSRKDYAQWQEFGLFRGSWGERHKVVHRDRYAVVVRIWRPTRCHR